MSSDRPNKSILYFLIFLASSQSAYFIFSTRNLRPISDDYCIANWATQGFFGAFKTIFSTWSGDILTIITDFIFVGFPLIHFPYTVASAVALITTLIITSILTHGLIMKKLTLKTFLFVQIVSIVSFVSFWSTPAFFLFDEKFIQFTNMISYWQTVNSQYLITPAFILLSINLIFSRPPTKLNLFAVSFFGLISGTSGYVFAVSLAVVLSLVILILIFKKNYNFIKLITFNIFLVIGMAISYLSPGAQARNAILENNGLRQELDVLVLLEWTFPKAIYEWWGGIYHLGSLITLTFGLLIGFILSKHRYADNLKNLLLNFYFMITLSLVSSVVSQLSEAFSYQGFWHLATPYYFIFIALLLLGYILGAKMNANSSYKQALVLQIVIGVALGISALNIYQLSSNFTERNKAWQDGPAPVLGILDIENKQDWVYGCWMGMKEYKGYPDRENF